MIFVTVDKIVAKSIHMHLVLEHQGVDLAPYCSFGLGHTHQTQTVDKQAKFMCDQQKLDVGFQIGLKCTSDRVLDQACKTVDIGRIQEGVSLIQDEKVRLGGQGEGVLKSKGGNRLLSSRKLLQVVDEPFAGRGRTEVHARFERNLFILDEDIHLAGRPIGLFCQDRVSLAKDRLDSADEGHQNVSSVLFYPFYPVVHCFSLFNEFVQFLAQSLQLGLHLFFIFLIVEQLQCVILFQVFLSFCLLSDKILND